MAIERVDAERVQVLPDPFDPPSSTGERVGARRAEDRPAARQDAADLGHPERHRHVLERALPAVAEPDELVTVDADALADDRADDRVETGAVAAAGEHPDSHAKDPNGSAPAPAAARDQTRERVPPGQVVPGVGQRVVLVGGRWRQRRASRRPPTAGEARG